MKTIDVTPTWAETARMLIAIIENSEDPSAVNYARSEIIRMGEIIDHLKAEHGSTDSKED